MKEDAGILNIGKRMLNIESNRVDVIYLVVPFLPFSFIHFYTGGIFIPGHQLFLFISSY